MKVYENGCLFEAFGPETTSRSYEVAQPVIGKSSLNDLYASILFDEFAFWEKELQAADVMSVHLQER